MDLPRLVQAILTRVREREGSITKTKLLKYLYLFDVEAVRQTGHTITGFSWIFHLYGPWTKEYEDLYRGLAKRGLMHISPAGRADIDAEFLDSPVHQEFSGVIDNPVLELTCRRIVDEWADRRLGEMLDYVYFHTEPMLEATRGAPLRFASIARAAVQAPEVRAADRQAIERISRNVQARRAPAAPGPWFTPPRYDDVYFEALRTMDEDDDGD